MNHGNTVKIVVVGDGAVGKTCLCQTYICERFDREYKPTIFNEYQADVTIKNKVVKLVIYDTAGQDDYEKLRTIAYNGAHVFLVCFSVDNRNSFRNVPKWVKEVQNEMRNAVCVLVGTKTDLRRTCKTAVTPAEGKRLAAEEKMEKYVECSSLLNDGVRDVINEAILCSSPFSSKKGGKNGICPVS